MCVCVRVCVCVCVRALACVRVCVPVTEARLLIILAARVVEAVREFVPHNRTNPPEIASHVVLRAKEGLLQHAGSNKETVDGVVIVGVHRHYAHRPPPPVQRLVYI